VDKPSDVKIRKKVPCVEGAETENKKMREAAKPPSHWGLGSFSPLYHDYATLERAISLMVPQRR